MKDFYSNLIVLWKQRADKASIQGPRGRAVMVGLNTCIEELAAAIRKDDEAATRMNAESRDRTNGLTVGDVCDWHGYTCIVCGLRPSYKLADVFFLGESPKMVHEIHVNALTVVRKSVDRKELERLQALDKGVERAIKKFADDFFNDIEL